MAEFFPHPASFKDPDGFVYTHGGKIYRQVNQSYASDYDKLIQSGLYQELVKRNHLLPHKELTEPIADSSNWYKTLQPQQLDLVSYPYEWCLGQLQDAALLTLSILKTAISHGMILKDASAYNVQFLRGKPIFIDTLSFEAYDESHPWVAYRQFCQHFLFPLYLEHYTGPGTLKILSNYLDGIPASTTASWLPFKSQFNLGVRLHVMLQSKIKARPSSASSIRFSKQKMLQLIGYLESIIAGIKPPSGKTTWSNYYEETIPGQDYLAQKEKLFREYAGQLNGKLALDLGANDGYFSEILASAGAGVVATDFDPVCINNLYGKVKERKLESVLPLVIDLSNPSPSIGFNNAERSAFSERIKPDLVIALALVHHLSIGKNMPLNSLAVYFSKLGPRLIIEFVPKEDEKVHQLLAGRKDVFDQYNLEVFEQSFSAFFHFVRKEWVPGTKRILYLMQRK